MNFTHNMYGQKQANNRYLEFYNLFELKIDSIQYTVYRCMFTKHMFQKQFDLKAANLHGGYCGKEKPLLWNGHQLAATMGSKTSKPNSG